MQQSPFGPSPARRFGQLHPVFSLKNCEGHGQRVQFSVFECTVNEAHLETLRLKKAMLAEEDNLRIYLLRGRREDVVEAYGKDSDVSFKAVRYAKGTKAGRVSLASGGEKLIVPRFAVRESEAGFLFVPVLKSGKLMPRRIPLQ